MSLTVEILDNSETVNVSDIGVYTLDINDMYSGSVVDIISETVTNQGMDIQSLVANTSVESAIDTNVIVQIDNEPYNAIHVSLDKAPQIEINDSSPIVSEVSNFRGLSNNPFNVAANGNVGLNIVDPQYDLHISGSLFAPIMTTSKMEVSGDGTQDLFLVKLANEVESKFVINLQGVTILGQFLDTPTAISGGMFYSASGDFYIGS